MNTLIIGKTAEGKNVPVLVDETGKLILDADFSGDITLTDIQISQAEGKNIVFVGQSALPAGAATEATLLDVLAKLLTSPATEAKQTEGNSSLANIEANAATEATLAAVLAALSSDPATQTTLAALLARVTACDTGAVVVASGELTATGPTVTRENSTAYEISRVIQGSACTLATLSVDNSGPGQFIQLFDSATVPADGVAPVWTFRIPAASSVAVDFGASGLPFTNGCAASNSTTGPTKTQGSANCFFTATKR
ncbi:MAG: hypothetical protein ACOYM3_20455 [Terrimicrobiaceae bacterium]